MKKIKKFFAMAVAFVVVLVFAFALQPKTEAKAEYSQIEVLQSEIAKTADNVDMTMWIILACVAILIGAGATYFTRERKDDDPE